MSERIISSLAVFNKGKEVSFIEKDGEIFFTAEEIGVQLGYSDPIRAMSKLFDRNKNELKHYTSVVKLTTDQGFQRDTRVFTEEGTYIISMLAKTNQAKALRAKIAILLRTVREKRFHDLILGDIKKMVKQASA